MIVIGARIHHPLRPTSRILLAPTAICGGTINTVYDTSKSSMGAARVCRMKHRQKAQGVRKPDYLANKTTNSLLW